MTGRMAAVGKAWVAETAVVTGDVVLGEGVNVWFGCVVRGDDAPIRIGARTNVQDGVIIHVDPDKTNVIGKDVTIGHGAICHGILVEDYALIGMGAVLLEGSVVREGAVVGAGAVVREGDEVPAYSLAVGVPAKVVKTFDREERVKHARWIADGYIVKAKQHEAGHWAGRVRA